MTEPLQLLSDEDLVSRAQEGSEAHFNLLVDRYTPLVYRVALGITGFHQEAQDIVQETFVKVFRHLDGFSSSKASFRTWLLTIARNQSINVFHSLKRRTLGFLNEQQSDAAAAHNESNLFFNHPRNPEDLLSLKEEFARVQAALQKLPERQRTALLLKTQEDMSYEEVAAVLQVSVSSVESLIFRARRKLIYVLED